MKSPVLIFDFDGTLVDTLDYLFTIGNRIAAEYRFQGIERHQIESFRHKTIRQVIRELDVPVVKLPAMLLKGMKEMSRKVHEVRLVEGIEEVLLQLKKQNVLLGLVSTNTMGNIRSILKNHNLENTFDFIHIGSGILGKPRALKKAAKQHLLHGTQIFYIGDEVRDIEASRKAGFPVIAVTWGYNSAQILRAHHPDYLVDHPRELLHLLKSIISPTSTSPAPDRSSTSPHSPF